MRNLMKKIAPVLAAVVILSGCAITPAPLVESSPVEVTVETAKPELPAAAREDLAVAQLKNTVPFFSYSTDAEVLELMHLTCDAIDSGMTFEGFVRLGFDSNIDGEAIGSLWAASILGSCPEHEGMI